MPSTMALKTFFISILNSFDTSLNCIYVLQPSTAVSQAGSACNQHYTLCITFSKFYCWNKNSLWISSVNFHFIHGCGISLFLLIKKLWLWTVMHPKVIMGIMYLLLLLCVSVTNSIISKTTPRRPQLEGLFPMVVSDIKNLAFNSLNIL